MYRDSILTCAVFTHYKCENLTGTGIKTRNTRSHWELHNYV